MKTAILIAKGVKQIMLTPEDAAERQALSYIGTNDDIHIIAKRGSFYDGRTENVFGADIYECQGGYYRAEEKIESVMLVLTPKKQKTGDKS